MGYNYFIPEAVATYSKGGNRVTPFYSPYGFGICYLECVLFAWRGSLVPVKMVEIRDGLLKDEVGISPSPGGLPVSYSVSCVKHRGIVIGLESLLTFLLCDIILIQTKPPCQL